MASYRFLVQQLSGFFEGCEFHHVPRAENEVADALSKLGSTRKEILVGVSLENIHKPFIKPSPRIRVNLYSVRPEDGRTGSTEPGQEAKAREVVGRTRGGRLRTRGCCCQLGD